MARRSRYGSALSSGRRLLHTRRISCQGFLRDDGGFEVEAHLQDTSEQDTALLFKSLRAGQLLHEMRVSMILDPDLVVRDLRAVSDVTPAPECPEAARVYANLRGLRVGAGFTRAVKERVPAQSGCTHLTELIGSMATTAFQTFQAHRRALGVGFGQASNVAGTCYAFREQGVALLRLKCEV